MDICATSVLCGLGMVEELNATPTVEGGRICQRKEGDVWQYADSKDQSWRRFGYLVAIASSTMITACVPARIG